MIREILKDEFMNCEKVKEICIQKGYRKSQIREAKQREGIKTVPIQNPDGSRKYLWYVPDLIWEKF